MSHLHLPDGILSPFLIAGSIITFLLVLTTVAISLKKQEGLTKNLPYIGFLAGLMIVAMSLEIVPLFYHVNLASVGGIIMGPALAFLIISIVNLFLVLMGHGGISTSFLNTLILSFEATIAWLLFRKIFAPLPIFLKTFLATFISLFLATSLTLGILFYTGKELTSRVNTLRNVRGETELVTLEPKRLLIIFYGLGSIGMILESLISAFLISYIRKIKPEILNL